MLCLAPGAGVPCRTPTLVVDLITAVLAVSSRRQLGLPVAHL